MQRSKEVELAIANALFIQTGFPIEEDFAVSIKDSFDASVQNVDFGDKAITTTIINTWVAEKTNNRITRLVNQSISIHSYVFKSSHQLMKNVCFRNIWRHDSFGPHQHCLLQWQVASAFL